MGHPQNSPRGLFSKVAVSVSEGKGLFFEDYSTSAALLTASASNLEVAGGVRVSGLAAGAISADARGLSLVGSAVKFSSPMAGKPAVDRGASFGVMSNSTGVALVINSTATTWKYLLTTSIQPT